MSLLTIRDLTISHNKQHILNNINLKLNTAEIIGIAGGSGSGKSTLLNSILHLLPQDFNIQGEIHWQDKNLYDLKTKQLTHIYGKEIAFISQNPQTFFCPVRTIKSQFIETISAHQKITADEIISQALDIFTKIGLNDGKNILNAYPFMLSGGMNQRINIALTMMLKPQLLIADEPTSALDVMSQAKVLQELLLMKQKLNTSILFVSHNLKVLAKIADKIIIMHQGKIIEQNPTEILLANPQEDYTKKLLQAVITLKK